MTLEALMLWAVLGSPLVAVGVVGWIFAALEELSRELVDHAHTEQKP